MRRREFIAALGAATAWPLPARAQQQPALPVVGFVNAVSADNGAAFRKGLDQTGYVEGRNVNFEHHFVDGQYGRLEAVMADLVRRRVAVIVAGGAAAALAAKAATATIPIPVLFALGDDPVKLGLVASLARPGGNVTGFIFFVATIVGKRLDLLKQLLPKAVHVAVLVNPASVTSTETALREVQEAAPIRGLQIHVLNANTSNEIDAAFADLARERADALLVTPSSFFPSRRMQFAKLAARERIPTAYANRVFVEAGGLMSYGTDLAEARYQVGIYTGRILNGAKPADLPVVQSTRFQFVINLQTAKLLGIEVPPNLLALADEVID
jgi:putative ABC transport system substrate-binding protein